MLTQISKLLFKKKEETTPAELEEQKRLATCVLLLEAAHADRDCSREELAHLLETLRTRYRIGPPYLEELVELAAVERQEAIDLWQFTNHFNLHASVEERLALMEDVWRLILLDGVLEKHEDHFAHKLAHLLRLTHRQLIDAKLRAREQLSA